MSTLKKHVGRIRNTDRRCVVVYMEIPGNEENALVVDTDALPDRFHDALMDVIDSKEGQSTLHLHTLLSRRILPDLGLDMMNALHTYGQLRVIPIDNVVMYPAPSSPVSLRTIVDYNRAQVAPEEQKVVLENRILENQKIDSTAAQMNIAENIIRQAQDLEGEAARKREQAYRMAPTLRPTEGNLADPQVTDSPEVIEASVPASTPQSPAEATTPALAEDVASTEGMPLSESVDAPSYTIANEADLTGLPDDVKMAVHAALAQANQGYNIVESDIIPAENSYNIVETEAPAAPVVPAYDFVGTADHTDDAEDDAVEYEDVGNRVDTSDEAVQAFLDRAAHREDMADKELQASLQPKQPVGRPRKDGLPAGTVAPVAAPEPVAKKRGRPPKAKK